MKKRGPKQPPTISPKGEPPSTRKVIARTLQKLKTHPAPNAAPNKKAVESLSLGLGLPPPPTEIPRR
ncbi:hypothetical protein, partial [Salmonella enterica]|uniref:hypothetical protein n=1 Tax=Salmonella enterica TaxID=28901 RepID=UPI001CA3FF88